MSRAVTGFLLVMVAMMTGCNNAPTCDELAFYESATSGKRIESPDDLDALDEFKEMVIPEASPRSRPMESDRTPPARTRVLERRLLAELHVRAVTPPRLKSIALFLLHHHIDLIQFITDGFLGQDWINGISLHSNCFGHRIK